MRTTVRKCELHLPPDECRTREGDLLNFHVLGDGSADSVAVAIDNVDDTGREAGFADELGELQGGERREFGGLEHDCVAARESRCELPGRDKEC